MMSSYGDSRFYPSCKRTESPLSYMLQNVISISTYCSLKKTNKCGIFYIMSPCLSPKITQSISETSLFSCCFSQPRQRVRCLHLNLQTPNPEASRLFQWLCLMMDDTFSPLPIKKQKKNQPIQNIRWTSADIFVQDVPLLKISILIHQIV